MDFFSGVGVATTLGVADGPFPGGMPAGLEVDVAAGFSGVTDAFGMIRFGGVDFGTLGDPPGRGPVGDGFWPAGDCLSPGVPGVVLPPGNPGGTVPGAGGF